MRAVARVVTIVTSAVGLAAVIVSLWLVVGFQVFVPFGDDRRDSFLVNGVDPGIAFATATAVATIALTLAIAAAFVLSLRREQPTLAVVLIVALPILLVGGGGAALVGRLTTSGSYTELKGVTGGRDLIAFEPGPDGVIFERSGAMLHVVGIIGADDAAQPFRNGTYSVTNSGDAVQLSWPFSEKNDYNATITIDRSAVAAAKRGEVRQFEVSG